LKKHEKSSRSALHQGNLPAFCYMDNFPGISRALPKTQFNLNNPIHNPELIFRESF
jgi:hypothetical protein